MKLTQEQEAQLIRALKEKAPNALITEWLTSSCGLSFQESFTIRRKLLEKIQDEKNIQQVGVSESAKEARDPQLEAEAESGGQEDLQTATEDFFPKGYRNTKKRTKRSKEERLAGIYGGLADAPLQKYDSCATCGDPTFQCDCTCKDPNLIPF